MLAPSSNFPDGLLAIGAVTPYVEQAWFTLTMLGLTFCYYWAGNILGTSVGKFTAGIGVVRTQNGAAPGVVRGLLRTLGYALSAAPVGLGFVWGAVTRGRRGWHDVIAGTVVVAAPPRHNPGVRAPWWVRARPALVGPAIVGALVLVIGAFYVAGSMQRQAFEGRFASMANSATINPAAGRRGSAATVRAYNWLPAGQRSAGGGALCLSLMWDDPRQSVGEACVGDDGGFRLPIVIPRNTSRGRHTILFYAPQEPSPVLSLPFTVTR